MWPQNGSFSLVGGSLGVSRWSVSDRSGEHWLYPPDALIRGPSNKNFWIFVFNTSAIAKETTFNKELFDKAQSDGKIVIVSSWVKYCTSCASQMKVLDKAKNDFENIEYFKFDVRNKEIANLLNVQYQTTLLIFRDNKEIYRSVGETSKDLIYKAIQSSI